MSNSGTKLIRADYERHQVLTPICTLGFVDLETPYRHEPKAPAYFRAQLIFDDLADLEDQTVNLPKQGRLSESVIGAIRNVKADQWGPREANWPEEEYPLIKDGSAIKDKDGQPVESLEGKWLINAKTGEEYPPIFIGMDGKVCDAKSFKRGDQVQAQILARPYVVSRRNQGVTLRLVALKLIAKGSGSNSVWFEDTPEVTEETSDDTW